MKLRDVGAYGRRADTRQSVALNVLALLPPRIIAIEPVVGPVGSTCEAEG